MSKHNKTIEETTNIANQIKKCKVVINPIDNENGCKSNRNGLVPKQENKKYVKMHCVPTYFAIYTNGKIGICCQDYLCDNNFLIGDIWTKPLKQIWRDSKLIREKIIKDNYKPCRNCLVVEDTKFII